MAEPQTPNNSGAAAPASEVARPQPQQRGPPLHQIYALPVPVRTFPLPTFYPNNPISLFHVAYAWLGQWWSPPPVEPSAVHQGVWSPTTSSVHVTDEKATRALWEQGFYGKGSLSRSEPNWLKREQVRRGLQDAHVSEILTVQRREERIRAKWERARLEQDVIRQTRLDEAKEAAAKETKIRDAKAQVQRKLELAKLSIPQAAACAPVTPEKLLALPNSLADVPSDHHRDETTNGGLGLGLEIPNSHSTSPTLVNEGIPLASSSNDTCDSFLDSDDVNANGLGIESALSTPGSPTSSDGSKSLKRRKSVRFSPKIESTTFQLTDPPSPNFSVAKPAEVFGDQNPPGIDNVNGSGELNKITNEDRPVTIENKEHLQLMPEEAFFLSFGLGVLKVTDPTTGSVLSPLELFTLFRQYSYFPPRISPEEPELQPDDSFLVHYAVYHHFRSLGWVPRGGIKFGVDWLLYARGPVFDHAEFGLIVIPSYSDKLWKQAGKQNPQKSWQWFHGTIRVLSHVTKSLVLVYVDVPPPSKFDEALKTGFADVFKLYKVREVMVKRWSSNRNR